MSRQDERERVQRRLGELATRVGASRTAGVGTRTAEPEAAGRGPAEWQTARSPSGEVQRQVREPDGQDEDRRSARGSGFSEGAGQVDEPRPDDSPGGAGKWGLARLPGAPAAEPEDEDDVGRVRSPSWLEEPSRRQRLVPERFRGMRIDPGRRGVRTLAFVGLAAMVIAGVMVFRERPIAHTVPPSPVRQTAALETTGAAASVRAVGSAGNSPERGTPGPPPTELVVSVVGLVQRTGLVRLPEGSRVADALAAAGGPSEGADTSGLNLAQRLSDGDQVLVGPAVPGAGAPPHAGSTIGASGRAPSGSAAAPGRPSSPPGRIDLNTATEAELDALPGVGPVTARAIISWRTSNGRFASVEQLGEVDGIGPARLARLRDLVRV
ncbi:helix-hairpin-helix domain-containing protein [Nocardia asiatica]|uniref:helix-hairpin-helix domain-containing protein n=1 Tax=Nocardia asiatica TaxID=209252 RepID=UPI003EE3F131